MPDLQPEAGLWDAGVLVLVLHLLTAPAQLVVGALDAEALVEDSFADDGVAELQLFLCQ